MTPSQENELPEPSETTQHELNSDDSESSEGILYVGIDLGTSRTSVAASNGVRASIPSVVGYPKDVVGQKLLGQSVLFGADAIEKRMSLNFHRPLEKGVLKGTPGEEGDDGDVRAARDLINEKKVMDSLYGSSRPQVDFPRLLALYREEKLQLDELVSRRFALDEVNAAFAALARGEVARSVLEFE